MSRKLVEKPGKNLRTKIGCLCLKSASFLDLPWRSHWHVQPGPAYVEVQPLFVIEEVQPDVG